MKDLEKTMHQDFLILQWLPESYFQAIIGHYGMRGTHMQGGLIGKSDGQKGNPYR